MTNGGESGKIESALTRRNFSQKSAQRTDGWCESGGGEIGWSPSSEKNGLGSVEFTTNEARFYRVKQVVPRILRPAAFLPRGFFVATETKNIYVKGYTR